MGDRRPVSPMAPALPSLPPRREGHAVQHQPAPTALRRTAAPVTIVVLQPQGMADGQLAIQAVRNGQSVVLDASELDPALGQRLVDFTCGGVQAMDGQSRRLGEAVFLFTSGLSHIEDPAEPI